MSRVPEIVYCPDLHDFAIYTENVSNGWFFSSFTNFNILHLLWYYVQGNVVIWVFYDAVCHVCVVSSFQTFFGCQPRTFGRAAQTRLPKYSQFTQVSKHCLKASHR